jgi:N-acetylneuraminic acid mutarotase
MKKHVMLLLILIFLTAPFVIAAEPVSAASPIENSWTSKAPMNQARGGLGVAAVNGKIYAIGGTTRSDEWAGGIVGTNEEYNPATDTWTYKASMPTPRVTFAIAVYKDKIYCIGGTTHSNVNEVYNPATNTWSTGAPAPIGGSGMQANVVGDAIFLIGGVPNATLNEVYYPANNSWAIKASIPTQRSYLGESYVSTVIDDKIYAIGTYSQSIYVGDIGGNLSQETPITQIYNPNTNTWTMGVPPPMCPYGQGLNEAVALSGKMAPKQIYVYAGLFSEYTLESYSVENNSWTFDAEIPTFREYAGIAVVNDKLYVIGGFMSYLFEGYLPGYQKPVASNDEYTPIGYGTPDPTYLVQTNPPKINILSPSNQLYNESSVALTFTLNKPVSSMSYSIDGKSNETITANTTITGLTSRSHNLTVYANDTFGNMGASETIYFNVGVPEPFPTALVAAASGASVAIIGIGLLVYFKKRKH